MTIAMDEDELPEMYVEYIDFFFFFEYIVRRLITKATVQGLVQLCIKCKTPLTRFLHLLKKLVTYHYLKKVFGCLMNICRVILWYLFFFGYGTYK